MKYTPDRWILVEIEGADEKIYKVFCTWLGGYVQGESWRINSGITSVNKEGPGAYALNGRSGSTYFVYTGNYGTSVYTQGVLDSLPKEVRVMTEREALEYLREKAEG